MTKRLVQTKREYEDYISDYMHEHHTSFKTPAQTKQTWRTERAYDTKIEEELVTISKLFISLLDKRLDLKFRQRLINFMANYLAVYVSKSKEYADIPDAMARQERAYVKLNNIFLIWLDSNQKKKKSTAVKHNQHTQKIKPEYKKRVLQQGDNVIQELTFGQDLVTFKYENLDKYRKKYRADLTRAIAARTK